MRCNQNNSTAWMLDNDAGQLLTTSRLSRCTSEPYHGTAAGGVRGDECALTGKNNNKDLYCTVQSLNTEADGGVQTVLTQGE